MIYMEHEQKNKTQIEIYYAIRRLYKYVFYYISYFRVYYYYVFTHIIFIKEFSSPQLKGLTFERRTLSFQSQAVDRDEVETQASKLSPHGSRYFSNIHTPRCFPRRIRPVSHTGSLTNTERIRKETRRERKFFPQ